MKFIALSSFGSYKRYNVSVILVFCVFFLASCKKESTGTPSTAYHTRPGPEPSPEGYVQSNLIWKTNVNGLYFVILQPGVYEKYPGIIVYYMTENSTQWRSLQYASPQNISANIVPEVFYTVYYAFLIPQITVFAKPTAPIDFSKKVSIKIVDSP